MNFKVATVNKLVNIFNVNVAYRYSTTNFKKYYLFRKVFLEDLYFRHENTIKKGQYTIRTSFLPPSYICTSLNYWYLLKVQNLGRVVFSTKD